MDRAGNRCRRGAFSRPDRGQENGIIGQQEMKHIIEGPKIKGWVRLSALLLTVVSACLGLAAEAGAQSLVDLAVREKVRRENLMKENRKAVVVTDRDLSTLRARRDIRGGWLPDTGNETAVGEEADVSSEQTDAGPEVKAPVPGTSIRMIPKIGKTGRQLFKPGDEISTPEALKEKLRKTREAIDLLQTRLTGLLQGLDARNSGDSTDDAAKKVEETEKRLEKARADEVRLSTQLEKMQ